MYIFISFYYYFIHKCICVKAIEVPESMPIKPAHHLVFPAPTSPPELLCNLEDLYNLKNSWNLMFDQKIRKFQHFMQNSGKVGKFGKILRLELIFMTT